LKLPNFLRELLEALEHLDLLHRESTKLIELGRLIVDLIGLALGTRQARNELAQINQQPLESLSVEACFGLLPGSQDRHHQ